MTYNNFSTNCKIARRKRACDAQALAETAVALPLLVIGMLLGIILVVNAGFAAYYKQELGFVTSQAAQYAATLSTTDPNFNQNVQTEVTTLLKALNLNNYFTANSTNLVVDTKTIPSVVSVTVTLTKLPIVGVNSIFPGQTHMSDKSSALLPPQTQVAGQLVIPISDGTFAYVPIVAQANGFPSSSSSGNSVLTPTPAPSPVAGLPVYVWSGIAQAQVAPPPTAGPQTISGGANYVALPPGIGITFPANGGFSQPTFYDPASQDPHGTTGVNVSVPVQGTINGNPFVTTSLFNTNPFTVTGLPVYTGLVSLGNLPNKVTNTTYPNYGSGFLGGTSDVPINANWEDP